MFINAEEFLKNANQHADREAFAKGSASVDHLAEALTSSRHVVDSAISEAIKEIRRQRQMIAQLTGENQHLREINHNLAEQLCQKSQDPTAPAEEPLTGSVTITTEGHIPDEIKVMLEAVVHLINAQ